MQSSTFDNNQLTTHPNIIRTRYKYGAIYGIIAGIAFAGASWGWDSYVLSRAHVLYPWMKLTIGIMLCGSVGGLAGWITARFERWFFTLLAWLGVTVFFSWLTVALPLQIVSILSSWLEPQLQGLLHYSAMEELLPRFWLAFTWILIFDFIAGLIQMPLVESAVFSAPFFGKAIPFLLGIVIFVISGIIADSLNNENLRIAATSMDTAIEFVIDNQGKEVDPALWRVSRASSLRSVSEQVTRTRKLIVSDYDSYLGDIRFLVAFDNLLVNCTVLYGHPVFCEAHSE